MNKIIPYLKSAKPLPDYQLWLEFEDGTTGKVDLSRMMAKGGVFEEWKNPSAFASFKITKNGKIEWTEDIDMDPDAFYLEIVGKTFAEYAGSKQLLRNSH